MRITLKCLLEGRRPCDIGNALAHEKKQNNAYHHFWYRYLIYRLSSQAMATVGTWVTVEMKAGNSPGWYPRHTEHSE